MIRRLSYAQAVHASATTTEAVRRAIQHTSKEPEGSGEALQDKSEDRRQVTKCKGRASVLGSSDRAKKPGSTVLTAEEEAVVVAF